MVGGFSPEFLEELKYKCDIVNIVSQYIPLVKKSGKYFGCCPFHNEKTPSMCVNSNGQYYHCFGCGASGNVINFVMEMESLSFFDAVKFLAEKAGMELPEYKADPEYKAKKETRDVLKQLMVDAARYYYGNLAKEGAGKEARDYLDKRGINEETRKRFGFGLSLGYDEMQGYLRRKGYTPQNLKDCGLVSNDKLSDAFANRIIVPIMNGMGEVIAFGGRIYRGEENVAKYKNSTNMVLFDKSRTVYGINYIKKEKKQGAAFKDIILVEGYMDVISLSAAGIRNAVAAMGTALTVGQAQEIKRLAGTVYVCYDGDGAGRKAAVKNVGVLEDAGLEVKVVSLDDGADPDDTVKKEGAEGFMARVRAALPLTEYKLKLCEDAYDMNSVNGRAKYVTAALRVLNAVNSNAEREVYLSQVSEKSGVSVQTLVKELSTVKKTAAADTMPKPERDSKNIRAARFVLERIINNADCADIAELNADWFADEEHRKIFDFVAGQEKGKIIAGNLFDQFDDKELGWILNNAERFNSAIKEKEYYYDCIGVIADDYLSNRIAELNDIYKDLSDQKEKRGVVEEIASLQKKLKSKSIHDKR